MIAVPVLGDLQDALLVTHCVVARDHTLFLNAKCVFQRLLVTFRID
jgi:hypothetical protein